ncbi:MAG TPA: hypothetical protein VHN36_18750 [Ilumatobacteraceae bacterium]|jgi:hypothetical protein|nr:hypothetical protein [Ilumatobacteraceae bacterium]
MKSPQPGWRRIARDLARAVAAVAAVMLVWVVVEPLLSADRVALAATNGGTLQVLVPSATGVGAPLTHGGSATAFVLAPPPSASCSGDSLAGYRAQSYIVPGSVDPNTLAFDSLGPSPSGTGTDLRQPLYDTNGTAWVSQTVGLADGLIVGLPITGFDFAVYGSTGAQLVPPGTYNLGIACTGPTQSHLDKYWNVQFTFSADPNDLPSGITWVVSAATTTTTTTTSSTTTTTAPSGSTTTTTTTTPRTTTTSTTSTTTTTTTPHASSTTTTAVASLAGSAGSTSSGSSGSLVNTGSSSSRLVVWAVLLITFGRMAVLLGRPLKVRPRSRS